MKNKIKKNKKTKKTKTVPIKDIQRAMPDNVYRQANIDKEQKENPKKLHSNAYSAQSIFSEIRYSEALYFSFKKASTFE